MMTEFEAGVRELVARLRDFERRMKKTEDDAGVLEQFVKLIRPGFGFDAPTTQSSPFSVSWSDCKGGKSGVTVTIKDLSGTTLATGTTGSTGQYSGTISLASDTPVTVKATAPSVRYQDTTFSATLTAGGTTAMGGHSLLPAAGYACGGTNPDCNDPILQTLTAAVTGTGICGGVTFVNDTLTYQATPAYASALGEPFLWLGTATMSHGGFNDKVYAFTNSHQLALVSPTAPGGGIFIPSFRSPQNCSPLTWTTTCSGFAGSNWPGTIHE